MEYNSIVINIRLIITIKYWRLIVPIEKGKTCHLVLYLTEKLIKTILFIYRNIAGAKTSKNDI